MEIEICYDLRKQHAVALPQLFIVTQTALLMKNFAHRYWYFFT